MPIWQNSKMTSIYYTTEPASEDYPCVVRIDDQGILVEYQDNGEIRQYRGPDRGNGHFELEAIDINGRASLHMFPGSVILEGSWIEASYRGMWRIKLEH